MKDIQDIKLGICLDDIKLMKKVKLKCIFNRAVKKKALKRLNRKKINHSKGKELKYTYLEMQKHLRPSQVNITHEEIITIFKLRTRMTDVKDNFKGKHEKFECEICKEEKETQHHILKCNKLCKESVPEFKEKSPKFKIWII